MEQRIDERLSPYRVFSRAEWAAKRADTPMTLNPHEVTRLRSLHDRLDMTDVDLVPRVADDRDLLGFQTGHRQPVGELLDRKTGVDVFREPPERNFHRNGSLILKARLGGTGELAEEP